MSTDIHTLQNALKKLLSAEFDEVVFSYGIPPAILADKSQSQKAIEVVRYAQNRKELEKLKAKIEQVNPAAFAGNGKIMNSQYLIGTLIVLLFLGWLVYFGYHNALEVEDTILEGVVYLGQERLLEGATVFEQNSGQWVTTTKEGKFSLQLPPRPKYILRITLSEAKIKSQDVTPEQSPITVQLEALSSAQNTNTTINTLVSSNNIDSATDSPPPSNIAEHEQQEAAEQRLFRTVATKPTTVSQPAKTFTVEELGIEMVRIPAGCFQMGSENSHSDEKPVHQVCIENDFWLSKTEITQAQWEKVMGNNPSRFKDANHPVERVSWHDVQKFMQKLDGKYRLPTEAEWEYAARAGSMGDYSRGVDGEEVTQKNLGDYAWYGEPLNRSHQPVAQKKPNTFGLYDMHGNVGEWCQDWYDENYYAQSPINNPMGVIKGQYKVLRGGFWYLYARYVRSAFRISLEPDARNGSVGFRCVLVQ